MTIEKFLSFWSYYNAAIIEGLVALIIISSLYLAFRSLFAKRVGNGDFTGAQVEVDTSKIEKTLQKILDNQAKAAKSASAKHTKNKSDEEDMDLDIHLDEMGSSSGKASADRSNQIPPLMESSAPAIAESPAEIAQLKLTLAERQAKIEELLAQLAAQPAASSSDGLSAQEKEAFQNQIQDLEARLAEYEIISEDIADLSKYREENEQLKLELSQALGKLGTNDATAAVSAETAPEPASAPSQEQTSIPEPTSVSESKESSTPNVLAEEPKVSTEEVAATEESGAELIDEELMKEFAAAVEGQKAAAAAAKEAPASAAPAGSGEEPAVDDAEKLMSEFENFVSKKS